MDGYNRTSFGQCDVEGPIFDRVALVGSEAPDFTLPLLDGGKLTLSSLRGKNVVLEFGNIT
jgi:cytochrome oxidase Cu insertion factor (SCO1/SenC/PrrC family)